jgi:hypothetical protein
MMISESYNVHEGVIYNVFVLGNYYIHTMFVWRLITVINCGRKCVGVEGKILKGKKKKYSTIGNFAFVIGISIC